MVYIMTRYQIYLNSNSVNTIDQLSKELDISRSQIIRDVLDRITLEYSKLLEAKTKTKIEPRDNPLLKMAGAAKDITRKDLSQHIDEIYLFN